MAAIGVAVALGTTGCGAGQISQTANQLPAVNGGNAAATWGEVEVRNVQIIYPADKAGDVFDNGGPFEVSFAVINSGQTKIYRLTKVEVTQQGAPSSAKVTLSAQPTIDPGMLVRAGNPANSNPAGITTSESSAAASASETTSASESASESATTSASASPSVGEVEAPQLGEAAIEATLNGTGESVAAGLTTELTFYFEVQDANGNWTDAGTVPVDAAVDSTILQTRVDTPRGGEAEGEGEGGH
ncbi:hypothetical protein ABLE92_20515 [Gordonia sp. VNQ95]|jgi:hypothetical protein|uniref:hypothetical protein n=1 Tax=Gordonia TaxID=2053 RepID=UPI0032B54F60